MMIRKRQKGQRGGGGLISTLITAAPEVNVLRVNATDINEFWYTK